MGTPKMRANTYIHTITINSLILPVLNDLVGNRCAVFEPNMNMCAHVLNASVMQITTIGTLENKKISQY